MQSNSRKLWEKKYPHEPFDLPKNFQRPPPPYEEKPSAAAVVVAPAASSTVTAPTAPVVDTVSATAASLFELLNASEKKAEPPKKKDAEEKDAEERKADQKTDQEVKEKTAGDGEKEDKKSAESTEVEGEHLTPASSTNSSLADVREGPTEGGDAAAAGEDSALEKAFVDFVVDDLKKEGKEAAEKPKGVKLEYDLAAAVRRQQMFYYQVRPRDLFGKNEMMVFEMMVVFT